MPKKNKEPMLRLVRTVVHMPGSTDRQLRLNLGADVGQLAADTAAAERSGLIRHYQSGAEVVVYPTVRALDLVLGSARKPARSAAPATKAVSKSTTRKTGGSK